LRCAHGPWLVLAVGIMAWLQVAHRRKILAQRSRNRQHTVRNGALNWFSTVKLNPWPIDRGSAYPQMAVKQLSRLMLFALVTALATSRAAQTVAPSCNGTGSTNLESEPKLAQVLGPESVEGFYPWKDCAPDRGECEKGRALSAKQPVQVILVRDAWSCVYFS